MKTNDRQLMALVITKEVKVGDKHERILGYVNFGLKNKLNKSKKEA